MVRGQHVGDSRWLRFASEGVRRVAQREHVVWGYGVAYKVDLGAVSCTSGARSTMCRSGCKVLGIG